MKKRIFMALVIVSALTLAGCSSKKKETEAPAPETQEAAAVQTEKAAVAETEAAPAAVETEAAEAVVAETESEDELEFFIDALDGETEEDLWETEDEFDFWETEDEYDYWETESEFEYFFDETETEAEIIPRPEFEVGDYLKIEDDEYLNMTVQVAPAQQVTDEEIDTEIADSFYYLEDYEDLVVKKEEGTVNEGDTVNIDYVGKKDGVAFENGSAEDQELVIGSGSFIDGFEEGLIGKEIGSTVDLNLTFPEDYGVEELNGADVVFTVKINYVSEIPEITDEIAEKLSDGAYKTVEDYRESIRAEIQSGYDEEQKNQIANEVMQKLNDLYPVEEYPQANVDYSVDMILSQYIAPYAAMYGMSTEDFVQGAYGMPYDDFMEQQIEPSAKQNVAQEIILGAIAEKEGITMTDEELQERLQGYADQYGVSVEEITQGQDMGFIRESEHNQKVMEWLMEKVTIEEVSETEAGTEAEIYSAQTEAETVASQTEAETAAAQTETEA